MMKVIRSDRKKGSEKFLKKILKKIWWFKIFDLTLHHFPLEKIGGQNVRPDKKKEIVLYSNITEQRSLKYLSS